MKDWFLNEVRKHWKLTEMDLGEYAQIKKGGMHFHMQAYMAEGAGKLFLMDMKALGGMMKMETVTFTPTSLDGPILSGDAVWALGKSTLVLELYDTTLSHPDFKALGAIKEIYASLPSYDPGNPAYYRLRLPESDYKRGRKIKDALRVMAEEYGEAYFRALKSCDVISMQEKQKKNAEFSEMLYACGGPAVNQFKKMIGEEKTKEFLVKYMY